MFQRGGGAIDTAACGLGHGSVGGARHATDTGRDARHAGRARSRLSQPVGGGRGGPHGRARTDGGKTASGGHARAGKRRSTGEHGRARRGARRAEGGAGTELLRSGDETRSDAGAEDAETEQRERAQHLRHGGGEVRLPALKTAREGSEQRRADADDDGEHHHLDSGGDHIAENPFGKERRPIPEREGHQHETGERRQLELEHRDEELDRQDEEGDEDQEPSQQQDEDGERAGRGLDAETGGRPVDDVGKALEVVEDQGEDADVEHLPDQAPDDVVRAAAHRIELFLHHVKH